MKTFIFLGAVYVCSVLIIAFAGTGRPAHPPKPLTAEERQRLDQYEAEDDFRRQNKFMLDEIRRERCIAQGRFFTC
jgi:hypothetical protein